MIWFKACPRCKQGDMAPDEDNDRHCLQCGYTLPHTGAAALATDLAEMIEIAYPQTKLAVGGRTRQQTAVAV